MPTPGTPALLHIVGYLTGATLYAMLLVMVSRAPGGADRLALATALLGLAWNIGELLAHGAVAAGYSAAEPWLAASAFGALGLLAAVVVHSVSRVRSDEPPLKQRLARAVALIAYGSAATAGALHLHAAATAGQLPSALGLEVITAGLLTLSIPLVIATRRHDHARRALWMSALAVFAVSALHLGRFHGANESWTVELLGHHASIPLAFAMLYRDYRFALADLFLKHALTLLALVSLVLIAYAMLAPQLSPSGPVAIGLLVGTWIATALLFPWLRRATSWFVDRVVLSRSDYAQLVDAIGVAVQDCDTSDKVLEVACTRLAPALSAKSVTFELCASSKPDTLAPNDVAVNTTEPPHYVLRIGHLAGGRRLLSDDAEMLQQVAGLLARRIDAVRLTDERYERMLREGEMRSLATEAELRALRAQVNPHFLFNALTTIGYLIQSAPPRALDTLMRLTTLLRSVLRSDGEFSTLGRERELIECYLQIERERFEERLTSTIDIPAELEDLPIPSLLVQPLVENAIKHGIARSREGGRVVVTAALNGAGPACQVSITVRNTGASLISGPPYQRGVGLHSVKRRLECYYGEAASLTLRVDQDGSTLAELRLPAGDTEDTNVAALTGTAKI
jgi:two-component system, LytTR family, sensor kinase